MSQKHYKLAASACCMLAASVVVAAIAVIFHPAKSDTARLISELQPKIRCSLCSVPELYNARECEKCEPTSSEKDGKEDHECKLTDANKDTINDIVREKVNDGTYERHKEILEEASRHPKHEEDAMVEKVISINLNVPLPSAHWYLHHTSTVKERTNSTSLIRNVSHWVWSRRERTKFAHSQNGITHQNGLMKFKFPGWYHLYYQMDFISNVSTESSYKARVFVQGREEDEEKFYMTAEKRTSCQRGYTKHGTSSPLHNHSCVVLKGSGTFRIFADDLLRLQVEMPKEASLHRHMSRSYFGALYLRKS